MIKQKYEINKKKLILEILLFAGLIIVDLLSKQFVFAFLKTQPNEHMTVLKGIFDFVMLRNDGASFGLFGGNQVFLIVITSIFMAIIAVILYWKPNTPLVFRLGMILILAGGVGNLVDRIAFGYVRDFIDYTFLYTFFKIDFAIGNVADLFCCVGVLMLIIYIVFEFEEAHFFTKNKGKKVEEVAETAENATTDIEKTDISRTQANKTSAEIKQLK